jgi:zinc transport system permease protein
MITMSAAIARTAMTELLDDFLWRAALAGLMMVLLAAPMGCLMVWRRLAFLADTLAHASVLGVAIALTLAWQPLPGVLLVMLGIMALLLFSGRRGKRLSEVQLAIVSYSGLAGGVLLLGLVGAGNISLEALLFGDLLATSRRDLALMAVTLLLLGGLLAHHWRGFVAVSVSPEIAQAEGIPVQKMQLLLYLMIALLIAVMMKMMGVLLIGAMLVIPAQAARALARSPEQQLLWALLAGLLALGSGLWLSWRFDLQTGPAIVVAAAGWLLLAQAIRAIKALT